MTRAVPFLQAVLGRINSPSSDLNALLLDYPQLKSLGLNDFSRIMRALLYSRHAQAQEFAKNFYLAYDNPQKGRTAIIEAVAAFGDERYSSAQAQDLVQFLLAQKVSLRDSFVFVNGAYRNALSFCPDKAKRQQLRNMARLDLDIPRGSLAQEVYDFFYYLQKGNTYELKTALSELKRKKIDIASLYNEEDLNYAAALAKYGNAALAKILFDFDDIDQVEKKFYQDGKEYDLVIYALKYENIDITESLISRGYIDLEKFDARQTSNKAIAHINKSQRLLAALKNLDVDEVENLINQGAVVNEVILQDFVKHFVNQEKFDDKSFGYLLLLMTNQGVDVNKDLIFKTNPNADNLLAEVVEAMTLGDSLRLIIALNLINCGARLKLSQIQKEKFIKIIIAKNPEYLEHFLELREINPDFALTSRVSGVKIPLLKYVEQNYPRQFDLVKLFIEKQKNIDQIARKKEKLLGSELEVKDYQEAPKRYVQSASNSMESGLRTRAEQAKFFALSEGDRVKMFLSKPQNGSEFLFGAHLLQVASEKKFAVKREILKRDADGNLHTAIKWDSSIVGECPLDQYGYIREDLPAKTKEAFADMAGCLAVLGEYDWNPANILYSTKTLRIVKIDNSLLVNGYFGKDAKNHRIFGSTFSRDLLKVRFVDPKEREFFDYDKFKRNFASSDEKIAQAYNREYNAGIDSKLLERIKRHISKPQNAHLKREFIAFMHGVQKMIDICEDKNFMDLYVKKYRELGQDAYEKANIARRYFEENVDLARVQYKDFLAYYQQISGENKTKVTAKFSGPKLGLPNQNKVVGTNAPALTRVAVPVANKPQMVVKKRLIDIVAQQEVKTSDEMQQLITQYHLPQKPENQKLLFEKSFEKCEVAAILKLYEEITKINPHFKETANKVVKEMRAPNMRGLQLKRNVVSRVFNAQTLQAKKPVILKYPAPEPLKPVLKPAISTESIAESGYDTDRSTDIAKEIPKPVASKVIKELDAAKTAATELLGEDFSIAVLNSAIAKIKSWQNEWQKYTGLEDRTKIYNEIKLTVSEQKNLAAFTLSHWSQGGFLNALGGIDKISEKTERAQRMQRQSVTAAFSIGIAAIESWASLQEKKPSNVFVPVAGKRVAANLQQRESEV